MNWDTEMDIKELLVFAKPTQRKTRLFAVACCKEIFHLMLDQYSKNAVLATELFADNKISQHVLELIRNDANREFFYPFVANNTAAAAAAATASNFNVFSNNPNNSFAYYATTVANVTASSYAANDHNPHAAYITANAKQLNILKDIVNPFLPTLNPNTLTYNNSIIPKLAISIYNSQNYQDLPILADILEDANEYNPLILNHLRSNQTHYKGCWAIDLLGKLK